MATVGKIRRSGCIHTFGIGSIIDFRSQDSFGAALSGIAMGLEAWEEGRAGGKQIIHEPRLEKLLAKTCFYLPPVPEETGHGQPPNPSTGLWAKRFPNMLQCPSCGILRASDYWSPPEIGDPLRLCTQCSRPGKNVFAAPVRFVVACEAGHIEEFPWAAWLGCKCTPPSMRIDQSKTRAGLAGLILECIDCRTKNSMEGVFSEHALLNLGFRCSGLRPWLNGASREECDKTPRALQRGASNVHFPVSVSALSIPPYTNPVEILLADSLDLFRDSTTREPLSDENILTILKGLVLSTLKGLNLTAENLLVHIKKILHPLTADLKDIRPEEYKSLSAKSSPQDKSSQFELRTEDISRSYLAKYFKRINRVVRLREVRVMTAFTRIFPPNGQYDTNIENKAPLSLQEKSWLPGIEILGEGIFLDFESEAIRAWKSRSGKWLEKRVDEVSMAFRQSWQKRHPNNPDPGRTIDAGFLLAHATAHALIRELTFECGYSTASLRERLYSDPEEGWAGLLIYTGTNDSDGTLGGLERMGKKPELERILKKAVERAGWCANDPLCAHGDAQLEEDLNPAACHACMLLPETSCEEFNMMLDRCLLVGDPADSSKGFFNELLSAK